VCNVFTLHKTFSGAEEVAMIDRECRTAGIGCVDCKKRLAANLNTHLEPFRAERAALAQNPAHVWDILRDGAKRAQALAEQTLAEVKDAVGLP
jgi:tryptophanyl-tRNA synthetase